VALVYLVQHAEKEPGPGDPGLTTAGREQVDRFARWLYSSPSWRAQETARLIAAVLGVAITTDPRLRERMNWDGSRTIEAFLDDWRRSVMDRDFIPPDGESSRQAGDRMRAFVREVSDLNGTVVAVTHGGATTDVLRTLLGDDELPSGLLRTAFLPAQLRQ
jgi:broad specificity phosphatase PhoE